MKKLFLIVLTTLLVALLSACDKSQEESNTSTSVEEPKQTAQESQIGSVTVATPFIRESLPGQKVAAAYFTLTNHGSKDIEVTDVSSDVAKATEFHSMAMQDSNMTMRKMQKVVIPANGSLILEQGGDHLMFIGLNKRLANGDEVNIDLTLSTGEVLKVNAQVASSLNDTNDINHLSNEQKHADQKQDEHIHAEI